MIGWAFPPNNYGVNTGANDGAIDAFAGKRLSSVVREIIQNSLDARRSMGSPVSISFKLDRVAKEACPAFAEIKPHLEGSRDAAHEQGLMEDVKTYEFALGEIEKRSNIPVFSIHDHNTSGLTGPTNGLKGSWMALVKGAGVSQKSAPGSLGSYGHGSKAPFAFSPTRSIYYLTRIAVDEGIQDRFQGKGILQSHQDPNETDQTTQGIGFYGHVDKLAPLINEDVPEWAKSLRESVTVDTGTSIFIPYTNYDDKLFPETRITVIANYFYAIWTGSLEVTVGPDLINSKNVVDWFHDCEALLKSQQNEIDVDHIKECFKSINTVLAPDHQYEQQIQGFGHIKWYMRVAEDLEKRVGIARNSGMLITRQPPRLKRFNNVKPFDLFLCVTDKEGSDFLKRVENPTHDNFEFERIKLKAERNKHQKTYKKFTERIRDLIEKYAALPTDTVDEVPDLGFIFSDVSDSETIDSKKVERGKQLQIRDGAHKKSLRNAPDRSSGQSPVGTVKGAGLQGGDGKKKVPGGNNENPAGRAEISGPSDQNQSLLAIKYQVQNLRANHLGGTKNTARLFFDSPIDGSASLQVWIVGESGSNPVKLKHKASTVNGVNISVERNKRMSVEVEFAEPVNQLALEATLHELVD